MNPLDESVDPFDVIERQRERIADLTELLCELGFEAEELFDATA